MSIIIIAVSAGIGYAQMWGGGMMGEQEAAEVPQQFYPYPMGPGMMGGYGMGPGMMGGYGMGPGMMGGYGMGPGMMGGYGYGGGPHCPWCGRGYGMGPGMMCGCMHTEEQRKFLDETADLRRELHGKKFDYFEASRKSDTKPETLSKLREEIRELEKKIYEKARK